MKKYRWFGIFFIFILMNVGCQNIIDDVKLDQKDDKIEIEFWYGLSGYPNQLMKSFIDDFNQSQEAYYVIGVDQSSHEDTFKALKSAIARKKVPSVVLLENQHLHHLATKGVILPLTSFAKENIELEDYIESYLEQDKIKEEIMGIPMYGTTQVLYYRKDFFEQYKLKPVDLLTWEALKDVSIKLTQKDKGEVLVYGWGSVYGTENLINAAISNGGFFLSEDGKEVKINTREWIDAWEYFRQLIHKEKVMKVHYGGDGSSHWYSTIDDIMQGRIAGYIGSCGDMGELDARVIGTYMLPAWDNKRENPRGVVNLQSICVPLDIDEEKKMAAFEWIKYLSDINTNLKWSTSTGFLPVRKSAMDQDVFYDTVLQNPDYFIPISQVKLGTRIFIDPTDGKIYELLEKAAYKVLIENIPSEEALKEAQLQGQFMLDEMLNKGR